MAGAAAMTPLLEARGLTKHFPLRREGLFGARAVVRAVDDVSFAVAPGETLGIVGESGCGKSTSARVLIRLIEPDSGEVAFDGARVDSSDRASIRALRRQIQMVFQNSHASLNPRLSVEASIAFAPRAHGVAKAEALRRAHDLLAQVGLEPRAFAHRYPHELSGGQRQRVNIARALALSPRLLLLDEPVSALDKSVQAQVLNLLSELKATLRLTYVFISHDLGVVQYVSDRVLVMYLGKIVEIGPVEAIYAEPRHPYTAALLAAMPTLDPDRPSEQAPLQGDPPSPIDPPPGCRFSTRCPFAEPLCRRSEPPLLAEVGRPERLVACHMANPGSGHGRAGGR